MGYAQDADQIVFTNEVKKALYRQKPIARVVHTTKARYLRVIFPYQLPTWAKLFFTMVCLLNY